MGRYDEVYRRSIDDPQAFRSEAAGAIRWRRKWDRVLDQSNPARPCWFDGGELNTCENALDVHVEQGRGDQPALIWDSAVAGETVRYTYRELLQQVARFAGALRKLGVSQGDRDGTWPAIPAITSSATADISTPTLVRERIGPVAFFKQAAVVGKLPKTLSGKILRGTIRKIADAVPYIMPPTIEDPAALEETARTLASLGYPHK